MSVNPAATQIRVFAGGAIISSGTAPLHAKDIRIDSAFNTHLALGQLQPDDPGGRRFRRRLDSGASDYNGEQHWRVANMGDAELACSKHAALAKDHVHVQTVFQRQLRNRHAWHARSFCKPSLQFDRVIAAAAHAATTLCHSIQSSPRQILMGTTLDRFASRVYTAISGRLRTYCRQ